MSEGNTVGEQRSGDVTGSMFWQRRWIIVAVTLVVAGSAITLAFVQTPMYSSTSSVLVQPPPGAGTNEPNMANEKNLGGSTLVAKIVQQRFNLAPSPEELLIGLSLTVPVDTDILQFHYLSSSPAVAQQRAQAFAEAYLALRNQQLSDQLAATRVSLRDGISALNAQLRSAEERAASTTNSRVQAVLRAEVSSFIAQMGILQQNLAEVTVQGSASSGRVVEPAVLPTSPAKPNKPLDGALGLLAGLLLGIGAAVLLDYISRQRPRARESLSTGGLLVPGAGWREPFNQGGTRGET